MCFTATVSMISWIINVVSSGLLFALGTYRKNVEIQICAVLFVFVGLQQLYDYICWVSALSAKSTANAIATKLAMLSVHIQPLVLVALLAFLKPPLDAPSMVAISVYLIVMLVYTVHVWDRVQYTDVLTYTTNDSTNSTVQTLDWAWTRGSYSRIMYDIYLLVLIFLIYRNFEFKLALGTIIYLVATYAFSFFKYQVYASTGRFWCFFG